MEIRIRETGQTKDISIVDPRNGVNWIGDLIGNFGGWDYIGWNDNLDCYETDKETFDWWADLVERYEAADNAVYDFAGDLDCDDAEEFRREVSMACGDTDLEYMPETMLEVIEDWKNR